MASSSKRNLSRDDFKGADKDEKESLLEHDSDLDEDMLFSRPTTSSGESRTDGKMDNIRIQIQEVTGVMRDNVQKVMERGERIEDLQEASDRLSMAGNEFRNAAKKAQRKAWLQNFRSRIIVVTVTLTVVLLIVVRSSRVIFSSGHHGALPGSQIANAMHIEGIDNVHKRKVSIIVKYS